MATKSKRQNVSKLPQKTHVIEQIIRPNNHYKEIKGLFVYCKQPENNIPDENTIGLYNFISSQSRISGIPIFNFNELQIIQNNPGDFISTLFSNTHISKIMFGITQLKEISDIEKGKNITIKISSSFCLNSQSMMSTEAINSPGNIIMVGAVEYEDVLFPGFIITFRIHNGKTIYIDSLCSSQKPLIKGSSQMLNIISIITSMFNSSTEESHKITRHTLYSMPGTRDFYKKNGFINMTEQPLSPNKQQPMSRNIIGGNRKRKTQRKSRRLVIKKIIQ
jgi:hypothetical protein